jgi:outer membrane protein assembly factor BamC
MMIAACSSDGEERPDYLDSYSIKNLEVPPTLTTPDTSQELTLPSPSEQAMQLLEKRDDASVQGKVSPIFEGMMLKSSDGLYWLEVQQDPDTLWPVLVEFWAHEGIRLERNEPLLGFMETEWVKEYQPGESESLLKSIFSKLSPDRLDKFRMRIERVAASTQTKIFVSHRGLEVHVSDEGGTSWRQRASDAELEREMLNRLLLFAGFTELQAREVLDAYRPYQARIRALPGDDTFEVTGRPEFVWHRVMQALDRIGVDITRQDKQQGEIEVVVDNVSQKLVKHDEEDLDESSWLVGLFTGGPGDEQLEQGKVTINISLTELDQATRMQLRHEGEALPVIGLAARFEEALVKLLK